VVEKNTVSHSDVLITYLLSCWWALHRGYKSIPVSSLMSFMYLYCTSVGIHSWLHTGFRLSFGSVRCPLLFSVICILRDSGILTIKDGMISVDNVDYLASKTCENFHTSPLDIIVSYHDTVLESVSYTSIEDVATLCFLERTFAESFGELDMGSKVRLLSYYRDLPFNEEDISTIDRLIRILTVGER